jgi:hypothetical protein
MRERRPTVEELDVVRWLLANAPMRDVSGYSAEHLADARVASSCTCGCASIRFVSDEGGGVVESGTTGLRSSAVLAEAFTHWPDGARAGVMLWGREGKLLSIELYELGSEASRRFPTVEVLRRWEEWFEARPGG